jgi:adhesin transport system membrane fusion protein
MTVSENFFARRHRDRRPVVRDESGRLDSLVRRNPLPSVRPLAWAIMIVIATAVVWAFLTRLDEVTVAEGEIVPQGQVRIVQHLEGGIIEDIYVTEGSIVAEGDSLLQIALPVSEVNREELQISLDGLIIKRVRLEAEAIGGAFRLPDEETRRRPDVARAERKTFEARASELASSLLVLRSQILQRALRIKEFEVRRRALATDLELAGENLAISTGLLAADLTPKIEHLELKRDVESLKGQIEAVDAAIPRAESSLVEARERERELVLKYRREASEEIGKTEVAIERTRELLSEATEQAGRTDITSPIDGIVKKMRYNTIGGVIQSGEPILEIVPSREDLVVEARLNPVDRGYIVEGQKAVIKISTYEYVRYGGIEGEVILIAPDATVDDLSGKAYFRVVVRPDKPYVGDDPADLPISPGMEATIDIHTGQKTVMDYLIKPVLKLRHEAFRER